MISVHSYKRWDHANGAYYFPKLKSTEAAIKARCGVIIPETEEKVATHKVDWRGQYNPTQRRGITHG